MHGDAPFGEPGDRVAEHVGGGLLGLVVVGLDVGDTGVVVDDGVQVAGPNQVRTRCGASPYTRPVTICSVCGQENPEGFRFCGACASPLATGEVGQREERKVVTALFCDLVGFTSLSESADPEDVNTMLDAYSAMARAQIENHGGVVQKFIGDAVVGVFGVPAAHEDDPERAVRAGLRIVEAAEELEAVGGAPLRLRVGINTGEALVRLDVNPRSGEGFLTGDAINTASRLQGVAPEMGVAVGVATYEASSVVFDYRELDPATVKGKAEPVRALRTRTTR